MDESILITSARGKPPVCHITWDGIDRYASVTDVRTTAVFNLLQDVRGGTLTLDES